ncbi:MAG: hypothetical protein MK108_03460 [Mariniblastus sp.]|nr:hypothetical protein [Mariniblastus sp.]
MVRQQRPDSWVQDAAIHDIFFIDSQNGWAVGEQGLILRTTDGGRNWLQLGQVGLDPGDRSLLSKLNRLQPVTESDQQNPIRCRWNSIHFVDPMNGWITGSYTVPYMGRSRAIVMKSKDGGASWLPMQGVVLPQISRLNFQSRNDGWAVGQAGNLYKTGIFYTRNGGQSWSTEGATKLPGWSDAEGLGGTDLVTVSQSGKLGVVRNHQYEASVILSPETPRIRTVRMLDEKNGWAAGDNGVLLRTRDGAASWRPVDTSAIAEMQGFDFTSLTLAGDRLYMAGNPGTYLFSLATDSGELQRHRTPVRTRIRKVYFASATHGWAAGDLGCILATRDAGLTWTVQRKGADRVGALMISVHPDQLPLEMMARFSSEENILTSALCLRSQTGVDLAAATSRLGGSMAQSIPGGADFHSPEMVRRLVREIRTQQPNIVVASEDPSGQVNLTSLLREAIKQAADRHQFVTQLTENGLTTWQVDRLVFTTPHRDSEIRVDSKKLLPRVGHLVEDYVAISRAQLGLPIRHGSQATKNYTYENYGGSLSVRNSNPFTGLRSNGANVPRRQGVTRMGNLNAINRASTKQRQFDHLLSCEINSPREQLYWRQQIQAFGLGLESTVVGVWMMQLADHYVELGKPEMAAHTLEQMINRVGDHALTPSALLWLSQYYSSDEFHWQQVAGIDRPERSGRILPVPSEAPRSMARTTTANGTTTLIWEPLPVEPDETDAVVQASHEEAVDELSLHEHARKQRLGLASRFLGRLKRLDPDLGLDPRVRFLEAQILQKIQGPTFAKNQFRALVRASQEMDPIAEAASREMVLAEKGPLPSDRLHCPRATSRPRLDGQLDDAVWQEVIAKGQTHVRELDVVGKESGGNQDMLLLAHDDEFLFVAARCRKIPGQSYHVSRVPRQRDQDLSLRDRLEITLDVDRDYRSSFQFVVDHRGWAGESVGGSVGWNPQWFIDQSQDETSWVVELAIPLSEITGQPVLPGAVMAARVNRLSYDSSSLWESERLRQAHAGQPGGLLKCLRMHPGSFQLLEFE